MRNLDHSRILAARLFATGLLLASVSSALADVHYVDVNSANAIGAGPFFYRVGVGVA